MIESDFEFECPYCGEMISIRIDNSAGEEQEFVYDCEVCCRPIHIHLEIDGDEVVNFTAEASD